MMFLLAVVIIALISGIIFVIPYYLTDKFQKDKTSKYIPSLVCLGLIFIITLKLLIFSEGYSAISDLMTIAVVGESLAVLFIASLFFKYREDEALASNNSNVATANMADKYSAYGVRQNYPQDKTPQQDLSNNPTVQGYQDPYSNYESSFQPDDGFSVDISAYSDQGYQSNGSTYNNGVTSGNYSTNKQNGYNNYDGYKSYGEYGNQKKYSSEDLFL